MVDLLMAASGPRMPLVFPEGSKFAGVEIAAVSDADLVAEAKSRFRKDRLLVDAIMSELYRRRVRAKRCCANGRNR
jgi:hypothetical protein